MASTRLMTKIVAVMLVSRNRGNQPSHCCSFCWSGSMKGVNWATPHRP